MMRMDAAVWRTFLHLLGVAVWVGGQIVMAGIVPALRHGHRDALPVAARAFSGLAWSAMALVVVTGLWGAVAVDVTTRDGDYIATFLVKMILVGVAVAAALVHRTARSRILVAVGGAAGLVTTLAAMLLGVALSRGV